MKIVEPIDNSRREEDRLLKKYPKIFRQKDLPMTETCMCWGLDVNFGWMPLLDVLCGYIQLIVDKYKLPQLEATQVKEKFGGLRFYYTWRGDISERIGEDNTKRIEDIEDFIHFAEYMSEHICEKCGTMVGVSQTEGWIVTLCGKCMEEYKTKRGTI